jgi:uncharacterized Fe-S center protein
MVLIDAEKCTGCGSCVKICREHCMSLVDRMVVIDYEACSTCTSALASALRSRFPGMESLPSILSLGF